MNNPRTQHNKGAAVLVFVVFFLVASVVLVYGIAQGAYSDLVQYRTLENSKVVFFAVEAGIEDAIHRHRNNKGYSSSESFSLGAVTVDATRAVVTDHFELNFTGTRGDIIRKGYLEFTIGAGASFSYGLQSDVGGILLQNSSSVIGNIYSNGTVVGTGSGDGNDIFGTVISAGPTGYVEGIHATGSVYANEIVETVVDKNAYCDSIDQSNVSGLLFCNTVTATFPNPADGPGPADQPTTTLPLSDADIDEQKAAAVAGGVIASTDSRCSGGTWVINSSTTTGPAKIECDVVVRGSGTVWTLTGQIWIEGNFTIGVGEPTVAIDGSLSGKAVTLIVDDESNRVTSSKIDMNNKASFVGAGAESYIILISQNNDEEGAGAGGGGEIAIDSGQSSVGDVLLYAAHGEIVIGQSGQFVGVAGRLLHLQNSAQIIYETGAISLQFPDGPGGGYVIGEWIEVE